MKVSLLNEKILFQKSAVVSDAVGNRKNDWEDYYSCFATVGGEGGSKKAEAGQTVDGAGITFTVRYCSRLVDVMSTGFRILFRREIYNILSVDHMNYKKKSNVNNLTQATTTYCVFTFNWHGVPCAFLHSRPLSQLKYCTYFSSKNQQIYY